MGVLQDDRFAAGREGTCPKVSGPARRSRGKGFLAVPFVLALLVVGACGSLNEFVNPAAQDADQPPDSLLAHTVFLFGDGGDALDTAYPIEPALNLLDHFLAAADSSSTVVFLGDNIYPSGLPPVTDPSRDSAEARIRVQLEVVEDFPGRIAFVPGNHDWGGDGLGGDRGRVLRQEDFIENFLDRGNTFLPDNGFPGPVAVELNDKLVLVALDTQWWLEPEKVYGNTGQYQLELEGEFLLELDDVLRRYSDRHVVVAAHHPIFSNGEHGGYFPTREDLYLLLPFSRRYLGTPQDLSNRKYRILRDGLLAVFEQHDHLVYAAGHEHNLQYFPHGRQHFVVSGSGSKAGYVAHDHGEAFAADAYGFAILRYYTDGSTWLEFWKPVGDGSQGERLYATRIHEPDDALAMPKATQPAVAGAVATNGGARPEITSIEVRVGEPKGLAGPDDARDTVGNGGGPVASTDGVETAIPKVEPLPADTVGSGGIFYPRYEIEPYAFYADSTVVVSAGARYDASGLRELLLGSGYRDVWKAPVRVPVIDLERTAGGLTPVRRGGGLQTISLRLRGADGDEYVLRSIDKDPTQTVPEYLQETIAQDVVQDQISAINPYGAFIIPKLADAAGVFHTAPRLVVVPYSDRLGIYKEQFGGMLALFEQRPDEDQSDEARFGYAQDIKGSEALFEDLMADNDESVDLRSYIRARLFDMLIGDWDRHDDQWRWAEFEGEYGNVYKPVPRDRDFAFFRFGGLPGRLARWLGDPKMRRFSNFTGDYGDVLGLNYNGAALDRRLTGPVGREAWLEVADSLKTAITDDVIEEAVRTWPEPIFGEIGEHTIRALKERRDKLPEVASEYYDLLAHIVDLMGSDKHERFEIRRLSDDETQVIAYKIEKDGDIQRELYRRTFNKEETGEIRIYGFGGNDIFYVTGAAEPGIEVRLIGGEGEDTFVTDDGQADYGDVYVYDTDFATTYLVDESVNFRLSPLSSVNRYDPLRFEYNVFKPVTYFGYNDDDGLFLGGGIRIVQPGFRKYPYAAAHTLAANFALRTRAYNVLYEGDYVDLWRGWNGDMLAEALAVDNFRSFYGLGNDTPEGNRDLYQARLQWVYARPTLEKRVAPFSDVLLPFTTFSFGPRIEYANVEPPDGYSEPDPRLGFTEDDLTDKYFVGAYGSFIVDGRDTLEVTESGMRWENEALGNVSVRGTDERYVRLASALSYFYTFNFQPRTTLAFRVGGAHNFGEFAFFQANTLGGQENLRGYGRTRFAGRTSVFTNAEARVKLFDFNAYLTKGEVGAIGFVDTGRVWWDDEESRIWHVGYGGGLWINPFYRVVIVSTLGVGGDGPNFDLSLGFLF